MPLGYFAKQEKKEVNHNDILGYVTYTFNKKNKKYTFKSHVKTKENSNHEDCITQRITTNIVTNHLHEIGNCLTRDIGVDLFLSMNYSKREDRLQSSNYYEGIHRLNFMTFILSLFPHFTT